MCMPTFAPQEWGARGFKASLGYVESLRPLWAIRTYVKKVGEKLREGGR